MSVPLPIIEVPVSYGCNLHCEGCAHFANVGHPGMLSAKEAERTFAAWKEKLAPETLNLCGGEPTLNPELCDIIALARGAWPQTNMRLVTNGSRLQAYPLLPLALSRYAVCVVLTKHHDSAAYERYFDPRFALLKEWHDAFKIQVAVDYAQLRWRHTYKGNGADALPYDGDPARAWECCPGKFCRQLFRGCLWKCVPVAYLQLFEERYTTLVPEWHRYLEYMPLRSDCTENSLRMFLGRSAEPCCSMCPESLQFFEKGDPLE